MSVYAPFQVGQVIQVVTTLSTAVSSGTTVIPFDDTIPQITEGTEFMTLAITPKSSTNLLVIEAFGYYSNSVAVTTSQALFQDSTANALAATPFFEPTALGGFVIPTMHSMTSATTSSTTFRIRAGGSGAGTVTFNGESAGRKFGAITKSFMRITEYVA